MAALPLSLTILKMVALIWGVVLLGGFINSSEFSFALTNPGPLGAQILTPQDMGNLTLMEQTLYATRFEKDPLESRLSRIEETIFGEAQPTQPTYQRYFRLKEVFDTRSRSTGSLPNPQPSYPNPNNSSPPNYPPYGSYNPSNSDGSYNQSPGSNPPDSSTAPYNGQPPVSTDLKKNGTGSPKSHHSVRKSSENPGVPGMETPQLNKTQSGGEKQSGSLASSSRSSVNPPPSNPAGEESDYPTVTAMEKKVFGQAYPKDDLSKRLDRLDQKVYGSVRPGDLMSRSDTLRTSVLGDAPSIGDANSYPGGNPNGYDPNVGNGSYNPYNPYSPNPIYQGGPMPNPNANGGQSYPGQYPNSGGGYSQPQNGYGSPSQGGASPDLISGVTQVEKQVLKQTYPNEPTSARLTRLEQKVFHAPAPAGMSDEDRLQRIIAVAAAGGTTPGQSNNRSGSTVVSRHFPVMLQLVPLLH
ncbi:MAG: hypothetical protein K2X66_01390 [Cyanobacteria bacterium]|nr:hypothetical protein [Cyanobacteriota bacterium]